LHRPDERQPLIQFYNQQKLLTLILAVAWVGYLLILSLVDYPPVIPDWAGPPHFSSTVLFTITLASTLAIWAPSNNTAWRALFCVSLLVITMEAIQILNPQRTIEAQDVIDGIAGAAVGSIISAASLSLLNSRVLVLIATITTVVAFSSPFLLQKTTLCTASHHSVNQWEEIYFKNFSIGNDNHSIDSTSNELTLCSFGGTASLSGQHLKLNGGGLRSGPLRGLPAAIRESGQFSFGIKFKTSDLSRGIAPREIVSLAWAGKTNRYLTKFLYRGSTFSTSTRLNGYGSSRASLANRITNNIHEVLVVHDGNQQRTWFDGKLISTDNTPLDISSFPNGEELFLTIGRRSDLRWQPFKGTIETLFVSSTASDPHRSAN